MALSRDFFQKKSFTIETRISLCEEIKAYFLANIEKQSRLFRIVWKQVQESGLAQHKLNTYLQNEYNIDKRTANTLIQGVKGRLKALKALKEVERANLQTKINAVKKRIKELNAIIRELKKKAEKNNLTKKQLFNYRHKKRELWQKKQKVNRLKQQIGRLDKSMKKRVMPLCWGGKKAFKAQYYLAENGFKSHEAWLNWYRKRRDNQVNYIGSAEEPQGNQNCQLHYNSNSDNDYFSLKVRKDLELMLNEKDKFIYLDNLNFKYQRDKLIEIIKAHKTPFSTRILRRGTKWYLQMIFTWQNHTKDTQTNILYGAIGIDYNAGFMEVSETDYYGNLTRQEHIPLINHGTGDKAKSEMREKISKLVKQAVERGKPIVAEELDFKVKKAKTLPGLKKEYNKMIHAFDYSRYKDALESATFRNKVELIRVKAAYTTIIGVEKYQDRRKLNRHQAASYVIARKGQGYMDKASGDQVGIKEQERSKKARKQ